MKPVAVYEETLRLRS